MSDHITSPIGQDTPEAAKRNRGFGAMSFVNIGLAPDLAHVYSFPVQGEAGWMGMEASVFLERLLHGPSFYLDGSPTSSTSWCSR